MLPYLLEMLRIYFEKHKVIEVHDKNLTKELIVNEEYFTVQQEVEAMSVYVPQNWLKGTVPKYNADYVKIMAKHQERQVLGERVKIIDNLHIHKRNSVLFYL